MNKKRVLREYFKYVSLNMIAMIGMSGYILADTFFVSLGFGSLGLTALNLALPIFNLITGIGLMFGMGAATKYSICKAKQQHKSANRIFTHAMLIGVITSILLLIIGVFFSKQICIWFGSDQSSLDMTNAYLKTIMCFAPAFIINNILVAFVRNDGYPKLAMAAMLASSLSNIVLDYIFIFPCKLGIFGAALATGLAPIISMCVLSIVFIRKKNNFMLIKTRIKLIYFKVITSLGVSSFITELASGVVILLFNKVILGLAGNSGVAAYGVVANIALVATAFFTGIAQGIQPLISKNYGMKNVEGVKQLMKYASVTAIAIAAVILSTSIYFAHDLVSIFNSENNQVVANLAEAGICIYFTGFLFSGFNIVLASFLSSIERPMNSFTISILRGCFVIVPALFILSAIFDMNGVWLSYPITELITLITAFIIVKRINLNSYKLVNK